MAWSWSHTQDAYDNAANNLREKSHGWLVVCYAEIQSAYDTSYSWGFDSDKYDSIIEEMKSTPDNELVNLIWQFAQSFQTCDNGGWNAYMCPFGCHTVPFGTREEDCEEYDWD